MNIWLTILIAGLFTYLTRLSFIFLIDHLRMPDWFRRGLRFVPAAVLSAIILPELVRPEGAFPLTMNNPQLFGGVIAILVAWKTKNVLLTIAAGMAALLIFRLIFGIV
jgi:branched-subunit amino acid transport protein